MRKTHEAERDRVDDKGYQVTCVMCGKQFESVRSDASFCSSTCRSKAHRIEKQRQRDIDLMLQYVDKVCANMKKRGNSVEFDGLNKAIKHISFYLNRVESR